MTRDNRVFIRRRHTGLVPGLLVIGAGVLFLLDNLNVIYVEEWWRFWPFVLIVIGLAKLVDVIRSH
jgi:hypothetical protein